MDRMEASQIMNRPDAVELRFYSDEFPTTTLWMTWDEWQIMSQCDEILTDMCVYQAIDLLTHEVYYTRHLYEVVAPRQWA